MDDPMTAHFVHLLDELRRHSLRMAGLVEDVLHEACESIFESDDALARRVVQRDCDVDREEVEVEAEVIRLLALYQPVGSDLRLLCTILKVNNDLERVADCAVNIAERASHLERSFAKSYEGELRQIGLATRNNLRQAIQSYASEDAEIARSVRLQDDAVDALYGQFVRAIIEHTADRPDSAAAFLDVLSIAKNLERIADHATNIAEDVIFLSTGKIVRHDFDSQETDRP